MLIHSDQIIDGNACIFQDSNTVQVLGEYNCCVPAVKCGQAVRTRRSQGGGHTSAPSSDGHQQWGNTADSYPTLTSIFSTFGGGAYGKLVLQRSLKPITDVIGDEDLCRHLSTNQVQSIGRCF